MGDVDPVALWGTIGTWVAVGMALVALIGIIGPLLAFRVAMTDWNRALNDVRDVNGDYISKGLGFGRRIRWLRRVKVPALAPSDTSEEFAIPEANKVWTFNKVKGTSCRASWARVCRLVECYTVEKEIGTVPALEKSRKGDLDVKRGSTRLPLSRYWVLVIGLLGRYADQSQEIRDRPSFLRYLEKERTLFSDSDSGSEGSGSEETEDCEISLQTAIRGFTGSFRIIKNNVFSEGEIGFERTLLFERRNHDEIGTNCNQEFIPLSHQFWLAMGLLPLPNRGRTRPSVASLEDAYLNSDGYHNSYGSDSESSDKISEGTESDGNEDGVKQRFPSTSKLPVSNLPVFKLCPTKDGPRTLRLAMDALRIVDVEILSFKQLNSKDKTVSAKHLHVCGPKNPGSSVPRLLKNDVQRLVCAFLEMPWNQWGYLIMERNTNWWKRLLRGAEKLLMPALQAVYHEKFVPTHHDVAVKLQELEISRLKDGEKVHRKQIKDLYHASIVIEKAMAQPIQIAIVVAVLIITDELFRGKVSSLIKSSSEPRHDRAEKVLIDLTKGRTTWATESFEFRADVISEGASNLGEAEIELSDVIMIALWTGLRCRLWLISPASTPLIELFRGLKEVVYVK